MQHMCDPEVRVRTIRDSIIGGHHEIEGPFGSRLVTYADYTASGRSLTFIEDNIMRGNAEAFIVQKVASVVGEDINELAWIGDDAATAGTFADTLGDGFEVLMVADADVIDTDQGVAAPADVPALFENLYALLPVKFRPNGAAYMVPLQTARRYASGLSDRVSDLGDNVITNGLPALRYIGWPVVGDQHINGGGVQLDRRAYLTPPANLVVGFRRNIRQDSEYRPRFRRVEVTTTLRAGFQYKDGEAIVRATNLPAAVV